MGYSPWGLKESDTTERLTHTHTHTHTHTQDNTNSAGCGACRVVGALIPGAGGLEGRQATLP